MLPATINAGCDMFLFFNDPDEDYNTMLNAYKTGIISEERMVEALTRILGLKAHMGLNKKSKEELCPSAEECTELLQKPEFKEYASAISKDCITLVKNKQDVLPLSPEKTKRIMIVGVKGPENPMMALAAMAMGMQGPKKTPAEKLQERLVAKGFDAFIYESPIDIMKKKMAAGEKVSMNMYFAGKHAISDFVAGQDLVITLMDVPGGAHPVFGLSKGGGEIPWYVHELPVVGISVNSPTMLPDVPMLKTYINTYDSNDDTMDALVEALVTGPEAFKGQDPIDSFCGYWDAKR
ncbi:MAG: hypothetical protein IKM20_03285, partial [Erysipelotrichales bacterium]|nr:hypothetical protein [Erysipelotrichales bacterium]